MQRYTIFKEAIDRAETIVISTHIFPDADGIGSQVALCLALRKLGKNVICVNEDGLLERYRYLDSENVVISTEDYLQQMQKVQIHKSSKNKKIKTSPTSSFDFPREIDLFIVVDVSSPSRIGIKNQILLENSKNFLFIDHHPCSPAISAIHCIDTSMAATGQLVGSLILKLGIEIDTKMALSLYTSILIDTSSFRYPTVTGETHRLIGKLLDTGISPPMAYNRIYGTKTLSHLHFLGKILSEVKTTQNGHVAWMAVREKDILKYKSDLEDTHAFINHLLVLDEVKVAVMFRDFGPRVKISLRSNGDLDVGEIAQALGGGGHNHSAATVIEGKLDEVAEQTIHNIELILKSLTARPR
jgi:phosphoesterase RecJ-like protein